MIYHRDFNAFLADTLKVCSLGETDRVSVSWEGQTLAGRRVSGFIGNVTVRKALRGLIAATVENGLVPLSCPGLQVTLSADTAADYQYLWRLHVEAGETA